MGCCGPEPVGPPGTASGPSVLLREASQPCCTAWASVFFLRPLTSGGQRRPNTVGQLDQTVFFGELLFGGSGWGVRVGSRAVVLLRRRLGAGASAQRSQVLSWGRQMSVPDSLPGPLPGLSARELVFAGSTPTLVGLVSLDSPPIGQPAPTLSGAFPCCWLSHWGPSGEPPVWAPCTLTTGMLSP